RGLAARATLRGGLRGGPRVVGGQTKKRVQPAVDGADPSERRLEQRFRRHRSGGERVGDLRERKEVDLHSMILGTRNACPSCCGDCESTFSRGRHGRGSSARRTAPACASPAKPRGSTPPTSTACSRSMYSSTCPSCAAKRSSSSGDNARRARRATCLTWARSMATVLLLRLV